MRLISKKNILEYNEEVVIKCQVVRVVQGVRLKLYCVSTREFEPRRMHVFVSAFFVFLFVILSILSQY